MQVNFYYKDCIMKFLNKCMVFLAVLSWTVSVSANDYMYQQQMQKQVYTGLYFSMSLGGAKVLNKNKFKYGLKMEYGQSNPFSQRSMNTRNMLQSVKFQGDRLNFSSRNVQLMNISFNDKGFSKAALMHMPLMMKTADGRIVYLNDDEDKKSNPVGKVLKWAGIIIGGLALTVIVIGCADDLGGNPEDNEYFLDDSQFCPA